MTTSLIDGKVDKKKIQYRFQRFEFKYFLNYRDIDAMYDVLLNNHMVPDPFLSGASDFYPVSSLYFDSPTLKCYNEKISGIKNRAKLRLRTYSQDLKNVDNVFLEIKKKMDSIVIKDRAKIDSDIYHNSLSGRLGDTADLDNKVIKSFFMRQRVYSMEPVVLVRYKRKPLVSRFDNNLRITFDYDLEAGGANSFYDHKVLNSFFPNKAVMEIKYNNSLPSWLHKIIQRHELSRVAISKYCYGIDTMKKNNQLKF